MKHLKLLCSFLFIHATSYAQSEPYIPAIYHSVPELQFVTDTSAMAKTGIYQLGTVPSFLQLKLDSSMHFQIRGFSCTSHEIIDTGVWFVYKTGRIGLKTKTGLKTFDLVKFDHFYFCIPPSERTKFVDDFRTTETRYKDLKPSYAEKKVYTVNEMTADFLMDNYYYQRDLRIFTSAAR